MAGAGRRDATAGRRAAAAAEAAVDPLKVGTSAKGLRRGGERALKASSGVRRFGSDAMR